MGHGAAVPDPRSGRRIRAIVPLDRDGDGRGRGRYGATEPVAKSVSGTPDRQRERECLDHDHPQRAHLRRIVAHTSTMITVQGPTCRSARTPRIDPFSRPGPERDRLPKVGRIIVTNARGLPRLGFDQFLSVATWTLPASACPCIAFAGTDRRNALRIVWV